MQRYISAVDLEKSYRLINHGPTVLVSAHHDGVDNVMAAAWSCGLDYMPPKLTVVLDKSTKTRELIEKSGLFVVQVPTVTRVFSNGHWHFESADKALRSIHYIAGGHFYAIGEPHVVTE